MQFKRISINNSFRRVRNKICFSFLFLIFFNVSSLFGQNSKIELIQALQIIKETYNVNLAYDGNAIKGIEVNRPSGNDLKNVLDELLADTPLDYQIFQENQILIRERQSIANTNQRFTKELIRIKGRVLDAYSNEPLPYALIVAGNNGVGTESDINGDFVLLLKSKESALLIRYLGYDNKQIKLDDFSGELIVKLSPNPVSLGSVLVEEQTSPFRQPLQSNQIKYSNTNAPLTVFGDAFRNISLLPGINIKDDLASEISIRGGETDENMILFDGIPLYNVGHYFGIFSNINSNVLEETTIYKNAFPSEYGGRTSGIIKMESRKMQGTELHGGLESNLLTSNAYLEIPIDEKIHLLVGGRTSNKNLATNDLFGFAEANTITGNRESLRERGIVSTEPSFNFQDANLKFQANINADSKIQFAAFYGNDLLEYNYDLLVTNTNENGVREIKETYGESQSWKNRGLNFTFDHIWNKEWTSEVSLSFAGNEIIQDVASTFTRTFPIREDKITSFSNSSANKINGTHLKAKATRSLDNYKLILGYEYTANTTVIDVMVDDAKPLDINAEGIQHSLFGSYESTLLDRLHFRLGLRTSYYELNDNLYLSPRVDLNYKITEQLYAKAAISKYYQFTQAINYEDRFARSIDLWIVNNGQDFPIASSNHQMLGLRWLNNWFDLDIELYRKNTYGFLQFSSTSIGFDDDGRPVSNAEYQQFVGNNINQGIDITIKKSFKNYTGWIAYTLSEAKHEIENVNEGNPFPSQMDQRHQIKFINQIEVGDFEISANYLFSSGRPFLDLSKLRGSRANRSSDLSDFFTYLKSYQRADLSIAYKFDIDKAKARIGFSVFNLFDRENIKYKQFIYTTPLEFQTSDNNSFFSNELKLLGRTLNVHFKIDL